VITKFLFDVNLPFLIFNWVENNSIFQKDINSKMPDSEIWDYCKQNNITIVTKDADFSDRIIIQSPPPKVIHFKTGNLKIKEFESFVSKNWSNIKEFSEKYKLVNVYLNKIEGIE
jgi:predicted nuclease of predicted toxin-antitoxin system